MAKTSLVVKAARPQKFKTRQYTRCNRCGRPRAVYRKFGLCRICLQAARAQGHDPRHDEVVVVVEGAQTC